MKNIGDIEDIEYSLNKPKYFRKHGHSSKQNIFYATV